MTTRTPDGSVRPVPLVQLADDLRQRLEFGQARRRFGTDFTEEDRVSIRELQSRLVDALALVASLLANTRENARLAFDQIVSRRLQGMVETKFKFYRRVTDDDGCARHFLDWLFDRVRRDVAARSDSSTT